jgi:hypothetical protein
MVLGPWPYLVICSYKWLGKGLLSFYEKSRAFASGRALFDYFRILLHLVRSHLKTQFTVCTYRWFIGKITTLSNIEIIEALPLGEGENAADQGALNSVFAFLTDLVKCIYNSTLKSRHATWQKKRTKNWWCSKLIPMRFKSFVTFTDIVLFTC